jgi:hypothetical protein
VQWPAMAVGRHGLTAPLAWPSRQLSPTGSGAARRVHGPWSPRGGHARGGGLVQPVASNQVTRCGGTSGDISRKKRGRSRARRAEAGLTPVATRRWSGGAARRGGVWWRWSWHGGR